MVVKVNSDKNIQLNLPGRNSTELMSEAFGSKSTTVRIVEIGPESSDRGPHFHDQFEEVIYVLEGSGFLKTSQGQFSLTTGDTVCIPAGVLHQTFNNVGEIIRLFCIFPISQIKNGTIELESWNDA